MDREEVILVDQHDRATGKMEKMEAHHKGILHRAFSVFIFNSRSEMLLQQRALGKYHSAGLWTNACCSHPRPGEDTATAAQRRLKEELGISATIYPAFTFQYETSFENGLTENEIDHVFTGIYDGDIAYNKEEVMEICFKSIEEIEGEIQDHPEKYTAWFLIAFQRIVSWHKSLFERTIKK